MRSIIVLCILGSCVAQLPVFGPVKVESKGSLSPQLGSSWACGWTEDVLGGMSDEKIVFSTSCPLEPADTNILSDVYVRDFITGVTVLVSLSASGTASDGHSMAARISRDGSHVVFMSEATNIVPGVSGFTEIVYHDLVTGITELITVGMGGAPSNGDSGYPDLSSDGRYVVFTSFASNLVSGDVEGQRDVFLRDRALGITRRVSETSAGVGGVFWSAEPRISSDASAVLFLSYSPNLAISDPAGGNPDWLVYDTTSRLIEVASIGNTGIQPTSSIGPASISADGRYVAFTATNLLEANAPPGSAYVRDRQAGVTEVVTLSSGGTSGNNDSYHPEISGDGRYVAFASRSSNLVPNDTNGVEDAFVRDRVMGTTIRVNVSTEGVEGNGQGIPYLAIDSSGRRVSFMTDASTIVQRPLCNGMYCYDVFVADLGPSINLGSSSGGGPWRPYTRVVEQWAPNPWTLSLVDAPVNSAALLAISTAPGVPVPFGVGAILPWPADFILTLTTGAMGEYALPFTWPASVPPGVQVLAQWGVADPVAPLGIALSNACVVARP
jgi:Tol biopolymer transport system component